MRKPPPGDRELSELARTVEVPGFQVRAIEQGAQVLSAPELADMESTNFEYLYEVDPIDTGTPTVFDLTAGEKVDVYDADWLSKLMES